MYNFLELVNQLCRKAGEVELNSSNFNSVDSFYNVAKDAVNRAIDDINTMESFWRFNFQRQTKLLVPGTAVYDWPTNSRVIDQDSFHIKRDDALNIKTTWLKPLTYKEYLQNDFKWEDSPVASEWTTPKYVTMLKDEKYAIYPATDVAYTIGFDTYVTPSALENWDDIPTIPEKWKNVIYYGALRDVYDFREDDFSKEMSEKTFETLLKRMQLREANTYDYATSRMVERNGRLSYG